MGNNSKLRLGIYCAIMLIFFVMVLIRQGQIDKERAKSIISSISQWQEKGIPVTVKKAALEDVSEYARLTISLDADKQWTGAVSENIKQKLVIGQDVYSLNDQQPIGKIRSIDAEISLETGMYRVFIEINNPEALALVQNIVLVKTQILKNVINVPNDIIDIQQGNFYVWKGNDNIARQQEIKIRSRNGYGVIVKSGINPGDILIYSGQSALSNGQKIQIVN